MRCILGVEAKLFAVRLPEVLTDAKHGTHAHFQLVTATVSLSHGSAETGYTYTGGKGGHAIREGANVLHSVQRLGSPSLGNN